MADSGGGGGSAPQGEGRHFFFKDMLMCHILSRGIMLCRKMFEFATNKYGETNCGHDDELIMDFIGEPKPQIQHFT